jgi:hypothetical protein
VVDLTPRDAEEQTSSTVVSEGNQPVEIEIAEIYENQRFLNPKRQYFIVLTI